MYSILQLILYCPDKSPENSFKLNSIVEKNSKKSLPDSTSLTETICKSIIVQQLEKKWRLDTTK